MKMTASKYVSVLNKLIVTCFRLIFYESFYGNLYGFGTEEIHQLHKIIYMKYTMAGKYTANQLANINWTSVDKLSCYEKQGYQPASLIGALRKSE